MLFIYLMMYKRMNNIYICYVTYVNNTNIKLIELITL